ncbi:MAG: hypothetical protein M0P95_17725 [Sulfuritalea sp.]|jgi:hypothetical protein|nr:hypothetical protein [Sulfuritalea sp.]
MADQKVSSLTVAGAFSGTDLLYVVQGGISLKGTAAQLLAYIFNGNSTLDGIAIGGVTPAAGKFTGLTSPTLVTASGALTITPAAGSNLNIVLSTTGDFAVNTNQFYVDTSTGFIGLGVVPTQKFHLSGSNCRILHDTGGTGGGYYVEVFGVARGNFGTPTAAFSMAANPGNRLAFYTESAESLTVKNGLTGLGQIDPTAVLHLKAGTAAANTAPIKLTSGPVNTTPAVGQIEYDNTFHLTNSDSTRRHIATAASSTVTGGVPVTNGYITVNIGGVDRKFMTTA